MARFRMMACACRKPLVPSGLAAWFRSLSLSTSPSTVITIRFSSQSMRHTWNLDDHSGSSKAATGLRKFGQVCIAADGFKEFFFLQAMGKRQDVDRFMPGHEFLHGRE